MSELGFPVYDADNHLYETRDALTRHLDKKYRREIRYVEVDGRTKLAICGHISDYIPNPTFEVVARPGAYARYARSGGKALNMREMGRAEGPIRCPEEYRHRDKRLTLMDQQGLHEMRQVFLEFGRRVAAAGVIESADDVFYLHLDDIRSIADSSSNEMGRCGRTAIRGHRPWTASGQPGRPRNRQILRWPTAGAHKGTPGPIPRDSRLVRQSAGHRTRHHQAR